MLIILIIVSVVAVILLVVIIILVVIIKFIGNLPVPQGNKAVSNLPGASNDVNLVSIHSIMIH